MASRTPASLKSGTTSGPRWGGSGAALALVAGGRHGARGHHEHGPGRRHVLRGKGRRQRPACACAGRGKGCLSELELRALGCCARRLGGTGAAHRRLRARFPAEAGLFLRRDLGRLRAGALELLRDTGLAVRRAFFVPRPVFNPSPVRWFRVGLGVRMRHPELIYPEIVAKASPDRPTFFGGGQKETWLDGHSALISIDITT